MAIASPRNCCTRFCHLLGYKHFELVLRCILLLFLNIFLILVGLFSDYMEDPVAKIGANQAIGSTPLKEPKGSFKPVWLAFGFEALAAVTLIHYLIRLKRVFWPFFFLDCHCFRLFRCRFRGCSLRPSGNNDQFLILCQLMNV